METLSSVSSLRAFVRQQHLREKSIAFVPTMGALHEGHKSCIDIARRAGDVLIVSIFVNPAQFGPNEDLASYPRTPDTDLALCGRCGCDAVFTPEAEEIYPADQIVWVEVGRLSEPLCGRARPGHFRGVATVVGKLFNIVEPDVAVFGQKDAQQALVIREMVRQLNLPVDVRLSPIVREPDGLALSSRNTYLSGEERRRATGVYESLCHGRDLMIAGERAPRAIAGSVRGRLAGHGIDNVEYVEVLDAEDLSSLRRVEGKVLLATAVRVGHTRLIDNMVLRVGSGGEVTEALLF